MSYVTKRCLRVSVETRIIIINKPLSYFINILCMHKTLYSLKQSWNVLKVIMTIFHSFKYPPQPPAMIHGSMGVMFQCIEQCMRPLAPRRCFFFKRRVRCSWKSLMNPKEPRAISDLSMPSLKTNGRIANAHSIKLCRFDSYILYFYNIEIRREGESITLNKYSLWIWINRNKYRAIYV